MYVWPYVDIYTSYYVRGFARQDSLRHTRSAPDTPSGSRRVQLCGARAARVCAPHRGAAMAASASPPVRARLAAAVLLLALGALLPGAHGGAPTMWLQGLLEIDPLAVCNDGSPAGFYFVPGTTQSNIWLVYLEGGMWCVASQWRCAADPALAVLRSRVRLARGCVARRRYCAALTVARAHALLHSQVLRPDVL